MSWLSMMIEQSLVWRSYVPPNSELLSMVCGDCVEMLLNLRFVVETRYTTGSYVRWLGLFTRGCSP